MRPIDRRTTLSVLGGVMAAPAVAQVSEEQAVHAAPLFVTLGRERVPPATAFLRTSGWAVPGEGGALYAHDPRLDDRFARAHPTWAVAIPDGRVFRLVEPVVEPEMFGRIGAAADQDAFDAMNDYLAANDGGEIRLRSGRVYVIGRQVSGRDGYYLAPTAGIAARGVSRLIVWGNRATLKFRDGLRFGSFDPVAERALGTITVDRTRGAAIGWGIRVDEVGHFQVSNLIIDGNSPAALIGGEFGDIGRQLFHAGLYAAECGSVIWEDVHVTDSCLDGFIYHYTVEREDSSSGTFVMRGCTADRVARNGLSYTGGRGGVLERCVFSRAGEAPNPRVPGGSFGSNPRSCCDIEAERSQIRDFTARNCRFLSGAHSHTAIDLNSGDIRGALFDNCTFSGRVWAFKPRIAFQGCTIHGLVAKVLGGQTDPLDNTQFRHCFLTDAPISEFRVPPDSLFVNGPASGGSGYLFEDCTFDLGRTTLNWWGARARRVTLIWRGDRSTFEDGVYVVSLSHSQLEDFHAIEAIDPAELPDTPFWINVDPSVTVIRGDSRIDSPNGKLAWFGHRPETGGISGPAVLNAVPRASELQLARQGGSVSTHFGFVRDLVLPEPPREGIFRAGSYIRNQAPVVIDGWVLRGWIRAAAADGTEDHVVGRDWIEDWARAASPHQTLRE